MVRKKKPVKSKVPRRLRDVKEPEASGPPPASGVPDLPGQGYLFGLESEDVPAPAGADAAAYWSKEYRRTKTLLAQLELKLKKGKLVPYDQVEQLLVDRITELRQGLQRMENALAPQLVALAEPIEAQRILHKAHVELLERYSRPIMGEAEEAGEA